MAAARCPTPSPIGAVAPMVVASEGGDAAERISVSANENSTTPAIIMIGGRGTAPTPNKAAAARALLGLVGGIGAGAGGAATSTSTSTSTHVCNKGMIHYRMNVDQWASEDRRAEESNIPDHELAPTPSEEREDGPTPQEWHEYNSYCDNLH